MRSSTVIERKSGAISRTRMPAPRNGGQRLKSHRMPRWPNWDRARNPCALIEPPGCWRSNAFEQHRATLPAADAERGHAALATGALEHLEHVQHDARAGSAD